MKVFQLIVILLLFTGSTFAQFQNFPGPKYPVQRPDIPGTLKPDAPEAPQKPTLPQPDVPYPDKQNPIFQSANIDSMRMHFINKLYTYELPSGPLSEKEYKQVKREIEKVVRFAFRYMNREYAVRRGHLTDKPAGAGYDSPLQYGMSALEDWLITQGCVETTHFPYIDGILSADRYERPKVTLDRFQMDEESARNNQTLQPSPMQSIDATLFFHKMKKSQSRATLDISYRFNQGIELMNVWIH